MDTPHCHACAYELDDSDNFCRRCGIAAGRAALPVVRKDASATIWQPQVSPVIKGAAVMAAGAVGQFLFRRAVSSMFGNGGRRGKTKVVRLGHPRERDGMVDEAQIITETIMMRRVRVRRQA